MPRNVTFKSFPQSRSSTGEAWSESGLVPPEPSILDRRSPRDLFECSLDSTASAERHRTYCLLPVNVPPSPKHTGELALHAHEPVITPLVMGAIAFEYRRVLAFPAGSCTGRSPVPSHGALFRQ